MRREFIYSKTSVIDSLAYTFLYMEYFTVWGVVRYEGFIHARYICCFLEKILLGIWEIYLYLSCIHNILNNVYLYAVFVCIGIVFICANMHAKFHETIDKPLVSSLLKGLFRSRVMFAKYDSQIESQKRGMRFS